MPDYCIIVKQKHASGKPQEAVKKEEMGPRYMVFLYTQHKTFLNFNILLCWSCPQYTDLLSHIQEPQIHLCQSLLPGNTIIDNQMAAKWFKYHLDRTYHDPKTVVLLI